MEWGANRGPDPLPSIATKTNLVIPNGFSHEESAFACSPSAYTADGIPIARHPAEIAQARLSPKRHPHPESKNFR
jgi:hypothetical protein